MAMKRRTFLQRAGAALGLAVTRAPAIAQARTKVKIGYLHTLAVDGQIWTGMDRGTFAKEGVELDLVQFTTGLELFQAMIGGSIDMLATGAVITMMRSERYTASSTEWVISITVLPSACNTSISRSCIALRVWASSAPNGSSISKNAGLTA